MLSVRACSFAARPLSGRICLPQLSLRLGWNASSFNSRSPLVRSSLNSQTRFKRISVLYYISGGSYSTFLGPFLFVVILFSRGRRFHQFIAIFDFCSLTFCCHNLCRTAKESKCIIVPRPLHVKGFTGFYFCKFSCILHYEGWGVSSHQNYVGLCCQ